MKLNVAKKVLVIFVLILLSLSLLSCNNDAPTYKTNEQRNEFLSSVDYRQYALTYSDTPYFVGRWFDKEINGTTHKVTLTDGAHLYFLIDGARYFNVNFTIITKKAEPFFSYSIDGGTPIRQQISNPKVSLPDRNFHTIRIIADGMTESEDKWEQEIGFALKSITADAGGKIVGIKPLAPVIYFYGDSITEGIRALNINANSNGNSVTNAYSWHSAENLGATPYLIGYGASGITKTGSFNTMDMAIDYLSKDRPIAGELLPDLIVINHGTNDKGQDANEFGLALTNTLNKLRNKYPSAPIVYLIPFNQSHASTISSVTQTISNSFVIQTKDWEITFTDNVHPNAQGAKVAGEKLSSELMALFGETIFN